MKKRVIFAAALLGALTLCQPEPARRIERVEPTPAAGYRVYLPAIGKPMTKKGVGGAGDPRFGDWFYSWNEKPAFVQGLEAVPMIWGCRMPSAIGGNSEWLLGFNEPDLASQANCTPTQAAAVWPELERLNKRLVAPVPSQVHPEWIEEFYQAYQSQYGRPPRLDALAVHCYMSASDCMALVERYKVWADAWGVGEIWITEFGFLPCWGGMNEAVRQMREYLTFLEADPRITRYAWFATSYVGDEWWAFGPDCNTSLVDHRTGQLTPLGMEYQ